MLSIDVEPLREDDDWGEFWDRLVPVTRPIRRGKIRPAERRAALA